MNFKREELCLNFIFIKNHSRRASKFQEIVVLELFLKEHHRKEQINFNKEYLNFVVINHKGKYISRVIRKNREQVIPEFFSKQ